MDFRDVNDQAYHIRELNNYIKALLPKEDIIDFYNGNLFKDGIVNIYLKILEKMNLLLQN